MATEVVMPQLGESIVEGTVTKWLKKEGESIEEFEPLLEVNTDKVDTEIPAPATGAVLKVYVSEGETVSAGSLLAVIGEAGEDVPEAPEPSTVEAAPPPAPIKTAPAPAAPASSTGRAGELGFISPVVARIAAEKNVDLAQVKGTGRGGRITKKDVLAYVESGPSPSPWEEPASGELFRPTEEIFGQKTTPQVESSLQPGSLLPIDVVRRTIADHMVRSRDVSPHVTTVMEADLSRVVAHRKANQEIFAREGVNLTYTAYFLAASGEAMLSVPIVNASWTEEGIVLHREVNIGVAVSLGEKGLIVPVVKNAAQMSLLALARSVNDLSSRARSKDLKADEVQGGTFTITNHGVSGSLFATPIINQPQAAILGVGAMQKRVVAMEAPTPTGETTDVFAIRPMVYLTLTFDHRILDGAIADNFLGRLVTRLQEWT